MNGATQIFKLKSKGNNKEKNRMATTARSICEAVRTDEDKQKIDSPCVVTFGSTTGNSRKGHMYTRRHKIQLTK